VRHPWPTNAPTGGRAGHSGASLSRSPSFHVKAFTVWLEADMRACVIDAHSASNHLRQGNERANLEQGPLIPVASLQGTGTGKSYHGDRCELLLKAVAENIARSG